MKFDDINLRTIITALYLNLGCNTKMVDNNKMYFVNIDGILNKSKQIVDIPIVHSNPFQLIAKADKTVPCLYFTVDISDDDQRYHQWRTKYIHRNEDENGELQSVDVKMEGDPVNYTINLTGEVRNDVEGVYLLNFFKNKFNRYGGNFYYKDEHNNELFPFVYKDVSHSRTRDLFSIITQNIVITCSFSVMAYWDYSKEINIETERPEHIVLIQNIKKD